MIIIIFIFNRTTININKYYFHNNYDYTCHYFTKDPTLQFIFVPLLMLQRPHSFALSIKKKKKSNLFFSTNKSY